MDTKHVGFLYPFALFYGIGILFISRIQRPGRLDEHDLRFLLRLHLFLANLAYAVAGPPPISIATSIVS